MFKLGALLLALLGMVLPAAAQPAAGERPVTSPASSQEELDKLLAPIALYPDALLAQVLMASTYPLEVVMAARWSKENPGVAGKALEEAMKKQTWDESVRGLTAVPKVLERMSENIGWMHKLGDAFLADQAAITTTVQNLRKKAQDAGNLKSTPEQIVKTEVQENKTVIIIEPADPQRVYVPTYDPYYIYGPWWYSYPPYYMYPPGYYYGTGMAFAAGVFWGAAIWGGINWGGNNVHIDHHKFNNFNGSNLGNGNWNHRVEHRKGVAYGDNKVAQRYDRGGNRDAVQSREQFRARADSGRAQLQGMDRSNLGQRQAGATPRAGDTARGRTGGGDLGNRGGSSGFSGAGLGSSSRAASTRGSSSRSSMGGGSRGGGGGGRGGGGRR
jgi:hypothetical protein